MTQCKMPVYKLVNGELVRKPGDIQDPSRRYGAVVNVQTGESYLREFTEEEERQANENAAKWEAEKPLREAEERQRAEEAEKYRESLVYENRIVAFLDILGWKEAIKKSSKDCELTKHLGVSIKNIETYAQFLDKSRQMFGDSEFCKDQQLTHFSDSILLSVKADKDGQSSLLWILQPIVSQLLNLGLFVRGGIAYGGLIHRNAIAYGPALIKAYELEQTAVYPRIVLEPMLADEWGRGQRYYHDELFLTDKTWRRDKDGLSFYDFLQPFMAGHFDKSSHTIDGVRVILEQVRPKIIANLSIFKNDPRVSMKYGWLAAYFNEMIDEYPEVTVEKIPC